MKKAALFLLLILTAALTGFGQTNVTVVRHRLPPGQRPKEKINFPEGLSLGVEIGVREYPLDIWYGGLPGYSIRSLYMNPGVFYKRSIYDFDITGVLGFSADLGAADPSPGAAAPNAKDADRKNWFNLYLEEGINYRIPLVIPGTISVFLNHRNSLYLHPSFPGESGGLIRDIRLERGYGGRLNWGGGYARDFAIGRFYGNVGFPFSYLHRVNGGIGLAMEVRLGYRDAFGIGIGGEIAVKPAFLSGLSYESTEFIVNYERNNFAVELKVLAYGAFESAFITPRLVYHFRNCDMKIGVEFSDLGGSPVFSPNLGFVWNF